MKKDNSTMKLIDVCLDIETCGLSDNAAIMQLAAVAFDRNAESSKDIYVGEPFNCGVDLRSCFVNGFEFNQGTCQWWTSQSDNAKQAMMEPEPHHILEVLVAFCGYIKEWREQGYTVCLWSQGTDFDMAILKHAMAKFGLRFPVSHKYLRDARTISLEVGAQRATKSNSAPIMSDLKQNEDLIYAALVEGYEKPDCLQGEDLTHDALYDARNSAYNVYCALRR